MVEKFSLDDLFMRIMPGGIFLGTIILIYYSSGDVKYVKELNFLYVFMFFTISYVVGELLQTIAHKLDHCLMVFYKFYMPSEIFLYKNNPVIKDDIKLEELIKVCDLTEEEKEIINNIDYEALFWFKSRISIQTAQKISRRCFWKMYHNVDESVQVFNRGYLFVRCLTCMFLMIFLILLFYKQYEFCLFSFIMFSILLYRLRGMSRMLVFKVVLNYLYK